MERLPTSITLILFAILFLLLTITMIFLSIYLYSLPSPYYIGTIICAVIFGILALVLGMGAMFVGEWAKDLDYYRR